MKNIVYLFFVAVFCGMSLAHAGVLSRNAERLEESGEYNTPNTSKCITAQGKQFTTPIICLLIPESTNDKVCMFDPFDGTYFGDFIIDDTSSIPQYDLATPINAIQGPDQHIYLSDQIADAVYVFDEVTGEYLYTYADTVDGLNNIRGIDCRGDHVFVTSGDDYVAEFDGPHSLVRYFIQDGSDPFDILFLDDGTALVSDIQGTTDNVRHYDTSGMLIQELFSVNFPEQIQSDIGYPADTFFNNSFSSQRITSFQIDGTIIDTIPFTSGRGVYKLGNGNFLATNSSGVFEIDPATGAIIEQKYTGSARFIELVTLPIGVNENDGKAVGLTVHAAPNPFSECVNFNFNISKPGMVQAAMYSVLGEKIVTLFNCHTYAGKHHVIWDGTDDKGQLVSEGVYFLKMRTPEQEITEKVVFLR